MVDSKQNQVLYYCFTLQCMIQLSIWFVRHVVRVKYIDINMDIVYL